jgi:hypothetical protein
MSDFEEQARAAWAKQQQEQRVEEARRAAERVAKERDAEALFHQAVANWARSMGISPCPNGKYSDYHEERLPMDRGEQHTPWTASGEVVVGGRTFFVACYNEDPTDFGAFVAIDLPVKPRYSYEAVMPATTPAQLGSALSRERDLLDNHRAKRRREARDRGMTLFWAALSTVIVVVLIWWLFAACRIV